MAESYRAYKDSGPQGDLVNRNPHFGTGHPFREFLFDCRHPVKLCRRSLVGVRLGIDWFCRR